MDSFKLPELKKVCLKGHNAGGLRSICFNSDGNYCLTAGTDRTVQLWNPEKNLSLKTYTGHGDEVIDARSSSDNSLIASGSKDKSVIIWDVLTGKATKRFLGHHGQINCVKFGGQSNAFLISGSTDNTLIFWDMKSKNKKPIKIFKDAKNAIIALDAYETYVMCSSADSCTRIYDFRQARLLQDCHGASVSSCNFAFQGNAAVLSLNNNEVRLFDVIQGKNLMTYTGHKCQNFKIESKVVYNNRVVASGSEDGYVYFWDAVSGNILKKLHAHQNVVSGIDFHPDHEKTGKMLTISSNSAIYWTN